MKKHLIAMVAAAAAMGIGATAANAATATGTVSFRGAVVTSTCSASLSGTDSGTTISVTGGTFSACSVGSIRLAFSPAWTLTFPTASTFSITNVQATLTAPIVGTCIYRGGLTGTYTNASSSGGTLTITGNTLARQSGSGSLCTGSPTVSGTLTLRRP